LTSRLRLIATVASTLVALVLLEGGSLMLLRWTHTSSRPPYLGGTLRGGRRDAQAWGVWGVPGYQGTLASECFNVAYSFNDVGARDRSRPRAGANRTIVLGDSFMEGYGVAQQERLSDLLEASRHRPYLNFATAGDFGPLQYEIVYRELASGFEHDALLVGFFPDNDFTDNDPVAVSALPPPDRDRYRPIWRLAPDGSSFGVEYAGTEHRGRYVPGFEPDASWLKRALRYSTTAILVNHLWRQASRDDEIDTPELPTGYFETNADRLRAAELIFRDLATQAGDRRRTVLVIPDLAEIDRARRAGTPGSQPFRQLLSTLSDHQWHVVDLMPALLAQSEDAVRRLYLACDGHWSAAGHQFALSALDAADDLR
jgi:hypothetical protein